MVSGRCLRPLCMTFVAAVVLAQAPSALAAGWESPLGRHEVVTPYGVTCVSGTHRGIDLAGSAGGEVRSPANGHIAFAGVVPADGGGTCFAVTVDLGDGLRVSLLPLDSVTVEEGEAVMPGDVVGRLASAGDDSSSETHLHLGLRRSETYLDPTGYLPASTVSTPDHGQPGGETGSGTTDVGASIGHGVAGDPVADATPALSASTTSASAGVTAGVAPALQSAANATEAPVTAQHAPLGRTTAVMDRLRDAPLVSSTLQPVELSVPSRPLAAPAESAVRPLVSVMLALGVCGAAAGIVLSRRPAAARIS